MGRILRLSFVLIDLYEGHLDEEACFLALFDGVERHEDLVRILCLFTL